MSKHAMYLEAARSKLEQAALEYARMKTLGVKISGDGAIEKISSRDAQEYEDNVLLVNLKMAAIDLLTEMSCTPLPPRKEHGDGT